MTVPTFDAARHHVGLGTDGSSLKGLMISGYSKGLQKTTENTQDIGGGRSLLDESVPEVSYWNQDSFIGGAFQYRITEDKERFADSIGLIPQLQDKGCISVPPLVQKYGFDPLASSYISHINTGTGFPGFPTYVEPRAMFPVAGSIYMLFKHGMFRWRSDTNAISFWAGGTHMNCIDAQYDMNDQVILVAMSPAQYTTATNQTPFVARVNPSTMADMPVNVLIDGTGTKTANKVMQGMHANGPGGIILVALGLHLWSVTPNDPLTANTDCVWKDLGRMPGRWIQSHTYNGRAYILCGAADGVSHIITFDGTSILPVAELPWNFEGWDITNYGGRQFVVGRGTDVNGADRYGEMHEISGASVRLVRTFQNEHYSAYAGADTPKNLKCVAVNDGLLWVSHQGRKLVAYDLTADAFWGASEYLGLASNFTLHKMCRGRAGLYGYGSRNGLNQDTGLYRVCNPGDTALLPSNFSCTLITSDFDREIARVKRWGEVVVQTRNQSSAQIFWSYDTGTTWTELTVVTENGTSNEINMHRADLSGIPATSRIRFKFVFPRLKDVSYKVLEINAMSVSYTMLGSSKWTWNFTVIGAVEQETYDDVPGEESEFYIPSELQDMLESWAAGKNKLVYRDLNGHDHNVTVFGIKTQMQIIGPRVGTAPEAFYGLTLQEV